MTATATATQLAIANNQKAVHLPAVNKQVRFGLIPPAVRPKAVQLHLFFEAAARPPKTMVDWSRRAFKALLRMYLNDRFGCCVIAGKFHLVGVWTGNDTAVAVEGTDAEVQSIYLYFSPNDQGCVITQVLDYFRDTGIKIGGKTHKIDGYAAVDWTNRTLVEKAIDAFGGLTIGFNVPQDWVNGAEPGVVWQPTDSPIVGGHDVTAVGYDDTGVQISTWGMVLTMSWAAFLSQVWVTECYALMAKDWYNDDGLAPSGFDVSGLKTALDMVRQGIDFDVPDGPAPVSPPPAPPSPPTPPTPTPVQFPVYTGTGNLSVVTGRITNLKLTPVPNTFRTDLEAGWHLPSVADLLADFQEVVAFVQKVLDQGNQQPAAATALPAGVSWDTVLAWLPVIVKEVQLVVPVIRQDYAAGKTTTQVLQDVIAALVEGGVPTPAA